MESPQLSRLSSASEPCERFEPNPFKIAILLQKESCKHCGRLWTEHEGVISEDIFEGYLEALRKAADAWQRSKESEWLFDGKECPKAPDDEFRMMSPTSLADVNAQHEGVRETPGAAKVCSFIDFQECNVAPEPLERSVELALQEAQQELQALRQRCAALEAKQSLTAQLREDAPETAPEAALSQKDLEELQQSCAMALGRLRKANRPMCPEVAVAAGSPRYLPKRLQGLQVLWPLAPEIYRVQNTLQARSKGLAYRRSKSSGDVDPKQVVAWGSTVTGRDEGDWIRCEQGVAFWAPWAEEENGDFLAKKYESVRKSVGDFVSQWSP